MAISFSDYLLDELKVKDWSQADLAKKAGVSRAAISDILSGRRSPGVDLCTAIADALDLPPETVFRAAGLLPPMPTYNAAQQEILNYKMAELTPEQRDELIKYIDFMQSRDGPPPTSPTTPQKQRQGSRPGEVVSAKD